MGLYVYAHGLVKLWEHAADQVELSTHISTKQIFHDINLKVSGGWQSIAKVSRPSRVHGCVCCVSVQLCVCCVSVQLRNLIALMWLLLIVRLSAVWNDAPQASCDIFFVELIANNKPRPRARPHKQLVSVFVVTCKEWIKGPWPVEWHRRRCWVLTVSCHRCRIRLQSCGSLSSSHRAASWPQSWTWSATWCWRSGVGNGAVAWCMCWECEAPRLRQIFTGLGTEKTLRMHPHDSNWLCMVSCFIQFRECRKLKCPRWHRFLKRPLRHIISRKGLLKNMSDLERCFGIFFDYWKLKFQQRAPRAKKVHTRIIRVLV